MGPSDRGWKMRDSRLECSVVIVDDSRTMQALLDNAFSKRNDFRVIGFSSDAAVAAEMIRRLRPDVVTIDLCMPYVDGAALLDMIADLKDICKIVVSDLPFKNLLLSAKLVEAGAAACLSKSDLVSNPTAFFRKMNAAVFRERTPRNNSFRNGSSQTAQVSVPRTDGPTLNNQFPIPSDENQRIAIIRRKGLVNPIRERYFDLVTEHVAKITAFPVCLLTFIDRDTQWIKSSSGFEVEKTPRDEAFCNYTIAQGGAFVVANAMADSRFADNPLVTGPPSIRSYAGHPVVTSDGVTVGALCVIDNRVRTVSKLVLDQLAGMSLIVAEMINQRPAVAA